MRNLLFGLFFYIIFMTNGATSTPIQLVWMKSPHTFQETVQNRLKQINYKIVQQKNISKKFVERNMLRLEIYVFLSGLPLFRETEFGVMGNKAHNPFEIELNINLSGTNQKGFLIDEHIILAQSDYSGTKTVHEIYKDIIQELLQEISRVQNIKNTKSKEKAR